MPSCRLRYFAISRLDQCGKPVCSGGLVLLKARIRARTRSSCTLRLPGCGTPSIPDSAYRIGHNRAVLSAASAGHVQTVTGSRLSLRRSLTSWTCTGATCGCGGAVCGREFGCADSGPDQALLPMTFDKTKKRTHDYVGITRSTCSGR
jgi:hypothetical protein